MVHVQDTCFISDVVTSDLQTDRHEAHLPPETWPPPAAAQYGSGSKWKSIRCPPDTGNAAGAAVLHYLLRCLCLQPLEQKNRSDEFHHNRSNRCNRAGLEEHVSNELAQVSSHLPLRFV